MEFKIGDRVCLKCYEELPEHLRSRGMSRMCGQVGTIEDKLYSERSGCYLYGIDFDNYEKSTRMWESEFLELYAQEPVTYTYELELVENVFLARLYEVKGDVKTEVARGHGHIIHEGVRGVAQAASYALKRIYDAVGGNF